MEEKKVIEKRFNSIPSQYSIEKKAYWSGDVSDNDYALQLSKDSTNDIDIQKIIEAHLLLKTPEEKALNKQNLYNQFKTEHPKRSLLDAAFKKCMTIMMAELGDIEQQVSSLEKK
jgi:hypothetical protein